MAAMDIDSIIIDDDLFKKIAHKLASNEVFKRNRALKNLKRYLNTLTDETTELGFLRLWKGLHYCMWMADKPIFQEDLAENISSLLSSFSNVNLSLKFFDAYLKVQIHEWFIIDNLRLNKFMMLVRLMFRKVLELLKTHGWIYTYNTLFCLTLQNAFLNTKSPNGFLFHVLDLLLPELENIINMEFSRNFITLLSKSFTKILLRSDNEYLIKEIKMQYFTPLANNEVFLADSKVISEILFKKASNKSCKNRAIIFSIVKLFNIDGENDKGNSLINDINKESFSDHDNIVTINKGLKEKLKNENKSNENGILNMDDTDNADKCHENIVEEVINTISPEDVCLRKKKRENINLNKTSNSEELQILIPKKKIKKFAEFQSLPSTPIAVVKKKCSKKSLTNQSSSENKKKVKFVMKKNQAQSFEESLNWTPKFDLSLKPSKGVLKPSPSPMMIKKKSPVLKHSLEKFQKKSAINFF